MDGMWKGKLLLTFNTTHKHNSKLKHFIIQKINALRNGTMLYVQANEANV